MLSATLTLAHSITPALIEIIHKSIGHIATWSPADPVGFGIIIIMTRFYALVGKNVLIASINMQMPEN